MLMLRGSREFSDRHEYELFLQELFKQLNAGRSERLSEELKVLKELPSKRLDDYKRQKVKVGPGSTINIQHNVYSVPSRFIKEWVDVRIHADHLEIWYGQKYVLTIPRIKGENNHSINYRHIISWLVRKPGAFENYRYHSDLFPTSRFRMAYDYLKNNNPARANKDYLKILHLAAQQTETGVDDVLRHLFDKENEITADIVRSLIEASQTVPSVKDVKIDQINLAAYDELLNMSEAAYE